MESVEDVLLQTHPLNLDPNGVVGFGVYEGWKQLRFVRHDNA